MGLERCMPPKLKLCKEMIRASLAGSPLCLPPNRDAFLHLCHHWDAGEHRQLSMLPWAQTSWRDTSQCYNPAQQPACHCFTALGAQEVPKGSRACLGATSLRALSSLLPPCLYPWGCGDSAGQPVPQLLPNHSLFIPQVFKIIPNPCLPGRKDVVSIASHPNRCIAT